MQACNTIWKAAAGVQGLLGPHTKVSPGRLLKIDEGWDIQIAQWYSTYFLFVRP